MISTKNVQDVFPFHIDAMEGMDIGIHRWLYYLLFFYFLFLSLSCISFFNFLHIYFFLFFFNPLFSFLFFTFLSFYHFITISFSRWILFVDMIVKMGLTNMPVISATFKSTENLCKYYSGKL